MILIYNNQNLRLRIILLLKLVSTIFPYFIIVSYQALISKIATVMKIGLKYQLSVYLTIFFVLDEVLLMNLNNVTMQNSNVAFLAYSFISIMNFYLIIQGLVNNMCFHQKIIATNKIENKTLFHMINDWDFGKFLFKKQERSVSNLNFWTINFDLNLGRTDKSEKVVNLNFEQESENEQILEPKKYSLKELSNNKIFRKSKSYKEDKQEELKEYNAHSFINRRISDKNSLYMISNKYKPLMSIDESKVSLEISERMKNILFCSISHELRTPINQINGMLQIIKQSVKDQSIMRFINISLSSCDMLMSKVEDILDYSMLEAGSCQIKKDQIDIREMMIKIEKVMSYQFDPNLITFRLYVSDNIPAIIFHDSARLKQILMNLIYNAFKFTEKGFVVVVLDGSEIYSPKKTYFSKSIPEERSKMMLNFSISDSGWGIEKRKRMLLYDLFSEAKIIKSNDVNTSSKLMGIGLTFWQKMLQLMNSKLRLTTALNIGSTFSFELETEYYTEKNSGKDSRQASTPINSLMSESVFLSAFSNNEALEK